MNNETEFFECGCYSPEHTLKFTLDPDTGYIKNHKWPELYTSVFLNPYRNWYQRIWVAIKYVFGYKCKFGHWDTFIMRNEDIERLQTLLKKYQDYFYAPKE